MLGSKKKKKQELANAFGKLKEGLFEFDAISEYFRNKEHTNARQIISDRTWNDLDMDEVFMFIDRTQSKVGQQVLYDTLRTIPKKIDFDNHEKLIEFFQCNETERVNTQLILSKLSKSDAFYITHLFQKPQLNRPWWLSMVRPLSIVAILMTCLIPFYATAALPLLFTILVNAIIHFVNKRNTIVYLKSLPQLIHLIDTAAALGERKECQPFFNPIREDLKVIKRLKFKIAFFQETNGTRDDLMALATGIIELIKMAYLLEPLFFYSAIRLVKRKPKELEKVFAFVGKVDTCVSMANLRNTEGVVWCHPILTATKNVFVAQEMYHPLIFNGTANSVEINQKSILLTGSNMSGKTTFIRTVGINFILGLTVNTCFAQRIEYTPSKIFTAIRISDDLLNDKSYYLEEVITVKSMLIAAESGGHHIFLLDELFKGTNTIERISAGKATLSSLATGNIVIVSTHDVELTEFLVQSFDSYHFCENVEGKNISFDYRLKKGRIKNSNAINILEANDYPVDVVKEARALARKLS